MEEICIFSDPVDLGGAKEDWEYSKITCDYGGLYEHLENQTTTADFYLEKTFSYGDFFLMGFITLFVLVEIVKIIWQNFVKK